MTENLGWLIFVIVWGTAIIAVLRHWHRHLHPKGMKFIELFENKPYGTDFSSIVAWAFYVYAAISQLSPVGVLSRLVSARFSRLVIDGYILFWWGVISIVALFSPAKIGFFIPLFIWRILEYTSIIIYQRAFRAGFPQVIRGEDGRSLFGYRALFVDVLNYLIFAGIFAAYYHGNAWLIEPNLKSPGEAFYFSIITMATVGYGDFKPLGHLRWVVMLQVLLGIFILVIIIGLLIGQRTLYVRREEQP